MPQTKEHFEAITETDPVAYALRLKQLHEAGTQVVMVNFKEGVWVITTVVQTLTKTIQ